MQIWRMRYTRTVTTIGMKLPRWSRVVLKDSVLTDGKNARLGPDCPAVSGQTTQIAIIHET
jgi:hypothetical protein